MLEHDPLHQFRHYPGHAAVQFVQVHQTLTINHDLAGDFGSGRWRSCRRRST